VVTVNDYLARRDAEWMKPIYDALGLTVGVSVPGMTPAAKRAAYAADVTYGTNNEFGFDYLRDNMAFSLEQRTQRGQAFAIVDEVDSILIDEARTPLIISGPADEGPESMSASTRSCRTWNASRRGRPGRFQPRREDQAGLSDRRRHGQGRAAADPGRHAQGRRQPVQRQQPVVDAYPECASLRAHHLFSKDVDYIVRDGEVVIVDEFTGRTLPGRRWSEGLHQAVEAKEGVPIQRENQTLASITFQNYFRLYEKLAGMTGTADTEAYEFQTIYGLEVVVIPTHKPMIRDDRADLVFLTQAEKFDAIVEDIRAGGRASAGAGRYHLDRDLGVTVEEAQERGGHTKCSMPSSMSARPRSWPRPGVPGRSPLRPTWPVAVPISCLAATSRPNWPRLGDDPRISAQSVKSDWKKRHQAVVDAGGLHIIGTERHESRRIDNQLRGRSGRQGDPGSSRFYLSLEDNLMRIFASERMGAMMQKLGMDRR
jgi:preprotein translocase subunit SecA